MELIINGLVDLYKELGVDTDAPIEEINRKFRRKALEYHPDKNSAPDAAEKFHFYGLIHSVLSDPQLRKQYDHICSLKSNKSPSAHAETLRFRQELQRQEELAQARKRQKANDNPPPNLRQLQATGIELRRKYQQRLMALSQYVSFHDLPLPTLTKFLQPQLVQVKWKHHEEDGAKIDENLLRKLMAQFGPVSSARVTENDGKYVTGIVEFQDFQSAKLAVEHNYRKSAKLWDGTPERKIASLLREAEFWGFTGSEGELIEESISKKFTNAELI